MKYLYYFTIFLSVHLQSQNTFNRALFAPPENICEGFSALDGASVGNTIQNTENGYIIIGGGHSPEYCGWNSINFWQIDRGGNILINKSYGKIEENIFTGYWGQAIRTIDNNYLSVGAISEPTNVNAYINIIKFNEIGDTIWTKKYGENNWNGAYAVRETLDGGFVITGQTESFGTATETNADIFLLRTDAEGNILWQKNFGGSKDDIALSLDIAGDGGFLIGGKRGVGGLADQKRTYVVKTDSAGNYQWAKQYDERLWFGCSAVLRSTEDGGFVMTSCTYVDEYNQHNLGLDYEINYIAKANHLGNVVWQHFPSTEHHVLISTLREMEDGSVIAIGSWAWGKGTAPYGYITKLSAEGEFIWERVIYYDAFSFNRFRDFQPTDDGGLILTGTAWNPERWHQDLWLVKVDGDGCLSEEVCDSLTTNIEVLDPADITPPKLFPNPTKDFLQIQIPIHLSSTPLQLQLTNIEGRIVKKATVVDGQQLEVSDLEAGVYIATWLEEGMVLKREKVVILE